jgi:putative transposase
MTAWLTQQREPVNRKGVQRLMRLMGLQAIYPKPRLSASATAYPICPDLLRGVTIGWFSRYVVAWRLSNTLDGSICLEMLDEALTDRRLEVFNTDRGAQFTAEAFMGRLESAGGGRWTTSSSNARGGR